MLQPYILAEKYTLIKTVDLVMNLLAAYKSSTPTHLYICNQSSPVLIEQSSFPHALLQCKKRGGIQQ